MDTINPPVPPPPNSNQVQLGVLMAAHYSATRASVDEWVRRRDQYLMLYIVGAGTTFGVFLSKPESSPILNLIPPLTLVVLLAYLSADHHIAYLCRWLKVEYTALLEKFVQTYGVISLAPWHWDNSASVQLFYNKGVGRWRYLFFALTILLANSAAMQLAAIHAKDFSGYFFGICLGTILLSFLILFIAYMERKALVKESDTITCKENKESGAS